MKPRFSNQRNQAMTLTEMLVVIVVLVILILVLLPTIYIRPHGPMKINCVNNLKEIGLSYHEWSGDNNDKFPMQVSVTNGGAMELIATGNVAVCFQVMSNELFTPKFLICPVDTNGFVAANFSAGFNNRNVSYFVGLDASTKFPQAFLSGDDNFEAGGAPVKSGLLEFSTNSAIAWTSGRHFSYKEHFWTPTHEIGNIGFCDGSVQQVTVSGLTNLLHQTGLATNRLAIP